LRYAEADRDAALTLFTAIRDANLGLLRSTGPGDLDREGMHVERGAESLRHMMRLYAGHDLAHRRQLERIIATIGAGSVG
jgi:hypothetical protein